jgi:hypothetical protein
MQITGPEVSAVYLHMSVGYPMSAVLIIVAETRGEAKAMMTALVLELCGGACAVSTIVFLALASVSKLMPDLERDEKAPSAQAFRPNERQVSTSRRVQGGARF